MAKRRKDRGKVKDRFKLKKWYDVEAPDIFDNKIVGEIPALEDDALINRVVTVSLADLTGKFDETGLYTNVWLQVNDVKGNRAKTRVKGYEMLRAYIKTIVRRRRSTVDDVIDVVTKDGQKVRIKNIVITAHRVSRSVERAIRLSIRELAKKTAAEKDFNELIRHLVFGQFANEMKNTAKKIVPIERAVVRRVDVLKK